MFWFLTKLSSGCTVLTKKCVVYESTFENWVVLNNVIIVRLAVHTRKLQKIIVLLFFKGPAQNYISVFTDLSTTYDLLISRSWTL
jgi:hypothetical protein